MSKRDERFTARLGGDADNGKMPGAEEVFLPTPSPFPARAKTTQLQTENEELKGQLEQLQAMLNQRANAPSNALDVQTSTFTVGDFRLTPTGLHAPEDVSFEDWEQIGHLIFRLEGAIQWLIGDWLVYGADLQYGDIKQIAEAMGRPEQTFYNIMDICRGVESYRRREHLSFAHHAEVKKLTPENQTWALEFAERSGYNVKQFRKWIKLDMPEAGLPEESTLALPAESEPVKLTAGEFTRFYHLNPAKAKPQERERAHQVGQEMMRAIREYYRKWGIEE